MTARLRALAAKQQRFFEDNDDHQARLPRSLHPDVSDKHQGSASSSSKTSTSVSSASRRGKYYHILEPEFQKSQFPESERLSRKHGLDRKTICDYFSHRRRELGIYTRAPKATGVSSNIKVTKGSSKRKRSASISEDERETEEPLLTDSAQVSITSPIPSEFSETIDSDSAEEEASPLTRLQVVPPTPVTTKGQAFKKRGISNPAFKYVYAESSIFPVEVLAAAFEDAPWPNDALKQAVYLSHGMTSAQVEDWFRRHRKKNQLHLRAVPGSSKSTQVQSSVKREPESDVDMEKQVSEKARKEGSPSSFIWKASQPTSSKRIRPKIQDDDENDYGSPPSSDRFDEEEKSEEAEMKVEEITDVLDEKAEHNVPMIVKRESLPEDIGISLDRSVQPGSPILTPDLSYSSYEGAECFSPTPSTPLQWLIAAAERAASIQNGLEKSGSPTFPYLSLYDSKDA